MSLFQYDFMQRALLGALVIGLAAPALGIYLVQRRLALIGDGIGHVALTGVGAGLLFSRSPVIMAVIVATIGAVAIELVRERGRTSGDLALALLFYGGIAGGVVLVGLSDSTSANLNAYLFGSLTTTSPARPGHHRGARRGRRWSRCWRCGPALFAVCHDEEYARVSGLPVRALNLLLAVTTAVTVTIAMRAVGRAADQRADGGAGGHRAAGHPGLPQHDGGGDGARPVRRRRRVSGWRPPPTPRPAPRWCWWRSPRSWWSPCWPPAGVRIRRARPDRRADAGAARGGAEPVLTMAAASVLVTVAR